MRGTRAIHVLLGGALCVGLVGCGGSGPNQAAKDACGDFRRASSDYSDQTIDAATYLGLMDIVAKNAGKSNDEDMIAAGVLLGTALLDLDENDTIGDLAQIGSAARTLGKACDGLGL